MTKEFISIDNAKQVLLKRGVEFTEVIEIDEGNNHGVFEVLYSDQPRTILKLVPSVANGKETPKDPLFGGEMSLRRELDVFRALKKLSKLKIPDVYMTDGDSFVLMEKLKGKLWNEFMSENENDERLFLASIKSLGQVFAELHKVHLPKFGDFISEDSIGSPKDNYANRFIEILYYRLQAGLDKGAIRFEEAKEIRSAILTRIEPYRNALDASASPAVIVLDDMHPANFFVDNEGQVAGFFDIEFAQVAHPSLEYYSLCIYLFNYLDEEMFWEAKKTFNDSYKESGGSCDLEDPMFKDLTDLAAVSRFVELACSYYRVADGLRDNWSTRYRELVFKWVQTGRIDYMSASKMQKEKFGEHNEED